jgi:aminoglycoside phosphotransferase (APT) family kinase protein
MLQPLLEHLTQATPDTDSSWQEWQIKPVRGGMNSLLYHVTSPNGDYAVKLSVRDERNRAGREFRALQFLRQVGLSIAPEPVFLDTDIYPQQVFVQSWLDGKVSADLPSDDAEWETILRHYASIHALSPDADMPKAVLNFESAEAGLATVEQQIAMLPEPTEALQALWQKLKQTHYPEWSNVPRRLVRSDPNPLNFIRRENEWASVDWENSGWGDPAFEIADMITHPAFIEVSDKRWDWVVEHYCSITGSEQAVERIGIYTLILRVWWVTRSERYLYEIPRGLDKRLAERPPNWEADMQRKYNHYLYAAQRLL